MALVNALLVRWRDGYLEVEDAGSIATHGKRRGFLKLGDAQSADEAERVASAILDDRKEPIVATTAALEPTGAGDAPYDDFDPSSGDWVTAPDETAAPVPMRVRAFSVTEDPEGNPIFVPELNALLAVEEARLQRWLKRRSNGTLAGTVESASTGTSSSAAAPSTAGVGLVELPPFSSSGPLAVSSSPAYKPPLSVTLLKVVATLVTVGTTPTTVVVRKNGATVATLTFAAGEPDADVAGLSVPLAADSDRITVAITAAGTGAQDLDVQLRVG